MIFPTTLHRDKTSALLFFDFPVFVSSASISVISKTGRLIIAPVAVRLTAPLCLPYISTVASWYAVSSHTENSCSTISPSNTSLPSLSLPIYCPILASSTSIKSRLLNIGLRGSSISHRGIINDGRSKSPTTHSSAVLRSLLFPLNFISFIKICRP